MFKLFILTLVAITSFWVGRTTSDADVDAATDRVSRAVHQAKDHASRVQTDLVARARHLACGDQCEAQMIDPRKTPATRDRSETRDQMFKLMDRFITLIEQDINNRVAHSSERDDN